VKDEKSFGHPPTVLQMMPRDGLIASELYCNRRRLKSHLATQEDGIRTQGMGRRKKEG